MNWTAALIEMMILDLVDKYVTLFGTGRSKKL